MNENTSGAQKAVVVRGVALSRVDWRFLELLSTELKAKGKARATASAAIRFLLRRELPKHLSEDKKSAVFVVGDMADGQTIMRRLDLRTAKVEWGHS